MPLVVYDLYRKDLRMWASIAHILSKDSVNYRLIRAWGGGEIQILDKNIMVVYLSAPMRRLATISLVLQGEDASKYIEPVTVHEKNKVIWNQGIMFATSSWNEPLPREEWYYYPTRPQTDEEWKRVKEIIKWVLRRHGHDAPLSPEPVPG